MTVFNGMSNESVLTSDSRGLASGPQWKSFVRYRLGGCQDWQPPFSWYQRALEWAGWLSVRDFPGGQTPATFTHTSMYRPYTYIHSLFQAYLYFTCVSVIWFFYLCRWELAVCLSVHFHHTMCHILLVQVLFLVLWIFCFCFRLLRCQMDLSVCYLSSLRHRLWAVVCVCSFQRPACSLMSVWLTSSLAQITIKAPADEATADGCSVLGCLVCLRGSVKYMLIRKKGTPVLPSRVDAALCSL